MNPTRRLKKKRSLDTIVVSNRMFRDIKPTSSNNNSNYTKRIKLEEVKSSKNHEKGERHTQVMKRKRKKKKKESRRKSGVTSCAPKLLALFRQRRGGQKGQGEKV